MTSAGELYYHLRADVEAADQRIRPYARETPLEHSATLSRAWGAEVWLKLENTQATGSFKVRGTLNRLLTTPLSQRALGVVVASTGNHGAATAYAMRALRVPGVVFVPEGASPVKLAAIEALGAEVRVHGSDSLATELEARRYAESRGLVYVSPYNDPMVIAGQGTIGAEIDRQLGRADALVVAVGGGGLVAGVAGYLKSIGRELTVIGCSPVASSAMQASVRAGRIVDTPHRPTLSDGTAGGIEPGAITFPLCRTVVDEWALLEEAEIAEGIRLGLEQHQLLEGAAGMTLAAARREAHRFPGGTIVVVLCGGNIALDTLRQVLCA